MPAIEPIDLPWRSANELLRLDGRHAVVTGAARGIGRAIARRLGEAGATIALADVSDTVHATAEALRSHGVDASAHVVDVADSAQVDELAASVFCDRGSLDVWVNNAGVFPFDAALDIPDEVWRRVLDVNTHGVFYGCRAAGRHMTPRGSGVIVNIASASGFRVAGDGRAHYAASKGAVRSMTQAFARELGPAGIRVLGIAPTATRTEGAAARPDAALPEGTSAIDQYALTLPLRRAAMPDDIARVVLFAASDLSSIMTGTVIAADAGQLSV